MFGRKSNVLPVSAIGRNVLQPQKTPCASLPISRTRLDEASSVTEITKLPQRCTQPRRGSRPPGRSRGSIAGSWRNTRTVGTNRFNSICAAELDPKNEPAWWNLGIAATALGDWAAAQRAWAGYGIVIPRGEGPLEMGLGAVPIRIDPNGKPEVVWCARLDPARARIASVPFPESGRGCGDVLLTDGAPRGYREYRGRQVPVLNELEDTIDFQSEHFFGRPACVRQGSDAIAHGNGREPRSADGRLVHGAGALR